MSISRVLAVAVAVVSLAGWSAGQADASILIDDFSTNQVLNDSTNTGTLTNGPISYVVTDLTSSTRTITASKTSGGSTFRTNIDDLEPSGLFVGSIGTAVGTGTISYSFADEDITIGGALHQFTFTDVVLTNSPSLTIVVNDGSNSSTATVSPTSGLFSILFTSFSGSADFASLNSIVLTFTSASNFGFSSTSFAATAVPEPSSMLMAGLGLVGLVGAARRRRSA